MIENRDLNLASSAARRRQSRLEGTRLWASQLLTREERDALDAVASLGRSVESDIDLISEGDCADYLIIIVEGWACRYTTTPEGGRQIPALLVPGDVGNLDSLMFDRLDYGVRSLTRATIVTLPRKKTLALAAQHPGIAQTLIWLAMLENVILTKWAQSLGRRLSKERVAHLLCELSARLDGERGNKSSFAFPLTHLVLADVLGITPIHVGRVLKQLRAEGMIVIADRMMTLPDVGALRQIAGFHPGYLHRA